jgi:hypothetical protein
MIRARDGISWPLLPFGPWAGILAAQQMARTAALHGERLSAAEVKRV